MSECSINYIVEVDYYDGDYDSETFANEENANNYLEICLQVGKENKNPAIFYRISRTETNGGMIVDQKTIKEWNDETDGY